MAKFFMHCGHIYGTPRADGTPCPHTGPYPYFHPGSVYGPFESDEQVQEAIGRKWPNDKQEKVLVFEGEIVSVKPSPLEKPESEKRAAGNMDNYVGPNLNGGYTCKDCGAAVLSATVAHPIHNIPGAGGGECRYTYVPYCPNCEVMPDFHGAPILERAGLWPF